MLLALQLEFTLALDLEVVDKETLQIFSELHVYTQMHSHLYTQRDRIKVCSIDVCMLKFYSFIVRPGTRIQEGKLGTQVETYREWWKKECRGRAMLRHKWAGSTSVIPPPRRNPECSSPSE